MEDQSLLRIQDLTVEFGSITDPKERRVVDGLNLDLRKGEAICLVGESGCGKTVTALSILGLLPKNARPIVYGQILFKGRDLLSLRQEELRSIRGKHISMIFQEPMTSLNPVLSIGEQLKEIFLAHPEAIGVDLSKEHIEKRCVELLAQVRLPNPEAQMRAYPHMLSGGQRQRVMIAMAVALSPSLIIADEPTTALDVTLQREILRLLRGLQIQNKSSLIFITHDLSLVPMVAERVYVMYKGRVVEEGSSREIVSNPMHPYTQALVKAIPDPKKRGSKLSIVRKEDQDSLDTGCKYLALCPYQTQVCSKKEPNFFVIEDRKIRCHKYGCS